MKFRLGACAAVVLLAACSGPESGSEMAALHGSAGGDLTKTVQPRGVQPTGRDVAHSIANAPDRGALMSYRNQGKPEKREGAFTYYPVAMSEEHALRGVVTGHMTVPMPDGSEVKLKYERHDEGIDGNWTWVGHVEGGDPMQEAIITFGEEAVFASIPQGSGKPALSIRTQGTGLYAVQMDPTKARSPNVGHNDMAIPEASGLVEAAAAQVMAANAQVAENAVAMAAPPTGTNTIDVVVGYTAGFRNQAALKQQSVTTALTFLLQVANEGFRNSNVNGYLRLVNALEVSYTDSNANQTALYELTGSNGSSNVTVPSTLAPIRTARDQYGADVALLVRGFQQPEHQGCGIAWLIGANGATVSPTQDAKWGYGVISFGNDLGADNNSYYCADESLIHEVGHLLGSAHDQANSTAAGRYPYSYGYNSAAGNFYTIMAYGELSQTSYRLFSNPNLTTCGEANPGPCGVANSADNARSLNQTIPVVAQFRTTVVPFGNARNDFDGDGKSDILWRVAASSSNIIWKSANSSTTQGVTSTDANWIVAGIGDFDGDGKADIFWRNSTLRQNLVWRSGSSASKQDLTSLDASWQAVGIGDFDGDSASDILWRNPATGTNVIWKRGSSSNKINLSTVTGPWVVAGVGDFDGDGKDDIFWRNTSTGHNLIWKGGLASGKQNLTSVDSTWQVIGIGDFDGDGRSDILWRNPTTGQNLYWRGGNATEKRNITSVASPWKVVAIGDYDGNGIDDILWRNQSQNVIWKGAESMSKQDVASIAATWVVQPPK